MTPRAIKFIMTSLVFSRLQIDSMLIVSVNTAPKNYINATSIGADVPEKYVDWGSWPGIR